MGFVRNTVDAITGSGGAKAAKSGAKSQVAMGREAIELQRETRDLMRQDLAPFRDIYRPDLAADMHVLARQGPDLSGIQALEPINYDPMQDTAFRALADEASRRVFSNQAARGKLGSGGTAEALQNQLVGLGESIRGQRVAEQMAQQGQRFGQQMQLATIPQQQKFNQLLELTRIGQAAAAGQASAAGSTGSSISDLLTGIGNAQAAGKIGAAQSRANAIQGLMQMGGQVGSSAMMASAMAGSDERLKENIKHVGDINGIPWFEYDYIDGAKNQQGTIAQLIQDDYPDAVVEIDGMLHVDYGKLPIWQ